MKILVKFSSVIAVAMLLSLGGCSLINIQQPSQPRYLSLMATPADLVGQDWLEKFTFDGVVEQSMLVKTELTASSINLVAMSFEGVPLLQASFDGSNIISETGFDVGLDPEQIFHDMQSIYWPLALIKQNLLLDTTVSEADSIRYFYRGQQLVRKIQYQDNGVIMTDIKHHYILNIIRLEDSH